MPTPNNLKLWIVDCLTGARGVVDGTPFTIGSTATSHLRVATETTNSVAARIIKVCDSYHIQPGQAGEEFFLDGKTVGNVELSASGKHSLVIRGYPFTLCLAGDEGNAWSQSIDHRKWYVYRRTEGDLLGPASCAEIPQMLSPVLGESIVLCAGMGEVGFYSHHIMERLEFLVAQEFSQSQALTKSISPEVASEVNSEYGEFICPVCWFKFDRGDTMNIAVHADMRGDSILGEGHMQRFLASRFNDRGQAIDAMGMVAPDLACPHCRRKLPPNFLDQPHYILSIVGAPSSGKSYYLSVLIKTMQDVAFKHFGVTFRDADPSENAVLNDMRNHLFSAGTPQDAYLAKTNLDGALYETLPRQGRMVKLPKPFIFRLTDRSHGDDGFSIVFYDNAGEHFEPGRNSADSPGAQHIAVASGIFFLFDPLYNPEFKRRLAGQSDPQLDQRRNDQQDILLAESESRIKGILALATGERIATPFAVIVGKCDAWLHLLGEEPLLTVLTGNGDGAQVNLGHIQTNSQRIRALLLDICPAIVANAEAISSNVRYFAASPLGHSPVRFQDGDAERIGPDPAKLRPKMVEDATLWVLTKIAPSMFPSIT
ncbi:MAG: hypothetical protein WCK77_14945 [Verrucomicrobiota bacterium]